VSPTSEPRPPRELTELTRRLDAALAHRRTLIDDPHTNVARLVDAAGDGLDGLVLERLGDVLIAQFHEGRLAAGEELARELCTRAAQQVGARAVYRKMFPRDRTTPGQSLESLHRDPQPWIGTPVEPEFAVREAGATFLVHPYDGYATGLYLDHRTQRARVRELATGRRVLNAFAYTCAFTVTAALGGAAQTVSVDVSRKYLEWGKRNLAANRVALEAHRFYCCDVFDYFRRAARQARQFDLVVLDPPTFARLERPRRVFLVTRDLGPLVQAALPLLAPHGHLLLTVNHRGTTQRRLEDTVRAAAREQRRPCQMLEPPAPPQDLRSSPEHPRCVLAQVL